eukprot:m.271113 g.271113  ORF g.271113 m.271113 type:complete len:130 (+) comp19319_c0_seq1:280-669(+)
MHGCTFEADACLLAWSPTPCLDSPLPPRSLRPLLKPCRVTDQDLPALVQVLGNNTSVTDLSLAYQPITDAGCTTLAQLVEKNTTIQKLSLRSNSFGPAGAEQLAAALQVRFLCCLAEISGHLVFDAAGL